MPQTETRARKALKRIGVARGNLAFLGQDEPSQLSLILGRFATRYRISASAMTRVRTFAEATPDDSAAALVKNLDGLMADASGISGINRLESELLNDHLHALAAECQAFALSQPLDEAGRRNVSAAVTRFLERDMGSGTFAGSALSPSIAPAPSAGVA